MLIDRARLLDLITGISDCQCIWDGDPEPFVAPPQDPAAPAALIKLAIRSTTSRGVEDTRRAGLRTTIVGYRPFVLRITARSYNDYAAYESIEKIRIRMRRQSSHEALQALNLAIQTFEAAVELDEVADLRSIYVTQLDIKMAALAIDVVDDADPGVIRTVDGGVGESIPGTLKP